MTKFIEFRAAIEGDEKIGWPDANQLLNSPHAPTNEAACLEHAISTGLTLDGNSRGEQQVNLVAVEHDGHAKRIVSGSVIAEMPRTDQFAPWLWRWQGETNASDLELFRFRPPEYPPTLELGGISVDKSLLGAGIGGAMSWVRSRIATHYAPGFFPNVELEPNVLVDCLPTCDRLNKVNLFWSKGLVPELKRIGKWEAIVEFCIDKANEMNVGGRDKTLDDQGEDHAHIDWFMANHDKGNIDFDSEDASIWVSWFIGNKMSDPDRNLMIGENFPNSIALSSLQQEGVIESIGSIDPATVPAMKNVQRNHRDLSAFAFFPTNAGINAKAGIHQGPRGELTKIATSKSTESTRPTIFFEKPESTELSELRHFRAYFANACLTESGLVVPEDVLHFAGFSTGKEIEYYRF